MPTRDRRHPEPVTAETEDLKEYFEERAGILEG
jgi:hypothetical protein